MVWSKGLIASALVSALLGVSPTLAADLVPANARSKIESAAAATIADGLRAQGRTRVIVELDLPSAREAWPDTDEALRRHALDLRVLQMAVIGSIFGSTAARTASEGGFDDNAVTLMSVSPMFAADVDAAALARLAADRRVLRIHPDQLNAPNLSTTTNSMGMQGESGAWALGATGLSGDLHPHGVAILDTGVASHVFLPGRVPARDMCFSTTSVVRSSRTTCPNNSSSMFGLGAGQACSSSVSGCDHGTHVAGIAAGAGLLRSFTFAGIARLSKIQSVQVFSVIRNRVPGVTRECGNDPSPCARTFDSDYIRALDQIYRERNQTWILTSERIDVQAVNMSLGSSARSTGFCPTHPAAGVVRNLKTAGIAVFMSSGNESFRNGVGAPSCIAEAVTIGNYDARPNPDIIAASSNMGPQVDLMAPGSGVSSSIPLNRYGTKSGTSMAAPAAAGAFVAIRSKLRFMRANPTKLTVDAIVNAMRITGIPLADTRPGGTHIRPMIRVDRALSSLMPERILTMTSPVPSIFNVTFEEGYVNPNPALASTHTLKLLTPGGRSTWSISSVPDWLLVQPRSGIVTATNGAVFIGANAKTRQLGAGTHTAAIDLKNFNTGQSLRRTVVARVTAAPPPLNDSFSTPYVFPGLAADESQSVNNTNRGATLQTGEATGVGAFGRTVWFSYTPTITGRVLLNVVRAEIVTDFGELYVPNVRAYRGTAVNTLQLVSSPVFGGVGKTASFHGEAGTTYRIVVGVEAAVGIKGYPWGRYRLTMTQQESRIAVSPQGPYTFVRRVGETTFSPPFIEIDAASPTGNLAFQAYTGMSNLVTIAPASGTIDYGVPTKVRLTPTAAALGLEVGQTGGSFTIGPTGNGVYQYSTDIVLDTRPANGAPGNDNRANAVAFGDPYNAVLTLTGSNTNASREAGEPRNPVAQGDKSVWWTFDPSNTTNGPQVTVDTLGSDFDTTLAVYRLNGSGLELMAANDDHTPGQRQSRVTFNLVQGAFRYYVVVDGYKGVGGLTTASGNITLTVRQPRTVN
jgi:hypothetical protein